MSSQGLVDGFMRGVLTGRSGTVIIKNHVSERKVDTTKEKAYHLLLNLLDPESSKRLYDLDNQIHSLSSRICEKSGWSIMDENFVLLRKDSSPYVIRCYDGYESTSSDQLRSIEEEFISSNQKDLMKLHQTYRIKEAIMNGGYMVKDESSSSLVRELIHFLGYSQEDSIKKSYK